MALHHTSRHGVLISTIVFVLLVTISEVDGAKRRPQAASSTAAPTSAAVGTAAADDSSFVNETASAKTSDFGGSGAER